MGRCIVPDLFDLRSLGKQWKDKVPAVPLPLHGHEANMLSLAVRTWKGFFTMADIVGRRTILRRLLGKQRVAMGGSLIGQLLKMLLDRSVPVWLDTPLVSLIRDGDAISGVIAEKDGKKIHVCATKGVILAAGGFEHNDAMRKQYQQHPICTEWTCGSPGSTGGGIQAGIAAGAAVEMMDDAWWMPTFLPKRGIIPAPFERFVPDSMISQPIPLLFERSLPYSMIVDSSGQRFMNESQSYVACGQQQYERNKVVPAIPAYLILDSRHRKYYILALMMLPRITPKSAYKSGFITKAKSLPELARKMGIDEAGLVATAKRFSQFAKNGRDEDFGRGSSAYDHFYSDPRVKPNRSLGPIEKPPFYALEVWPGDLGTMGGLLTDEHARVLRKDGSVIGNLYAAGNNTASVMGRTYPGPGATIGPAMVFGMIAGRHAAALSKD